MTPFHGKQLCQNYFVSFWKGFYLECSKANRKLQKLSPLAEMAKKSTKCILFSSSLKYLINYFDIAVQKRVYKYRIWSNYRTYHNKRTFQQCRNHQITGHVSTSLWKHMSLVLIWIASTCQGNSKEYQQHMLI